MELNSVILSGSVDGCTMNICMYLCMSFVKSWEQLAETRNAYFGTHSYWQCKFICQFSSKLAISWTFIFEVKESNRVHWDIHMWLSCKWLHIGQTLLLSTPKVACDPSIGTFTFAHGHSKAQSQAHLNVNVCKWDRGNITIAIKYEVAYVLLFCLVIENLEWL